MFWVDNWVLFEHGLSLHFTCRRLLRLFHALSTRWSRLRVWQCPRYDRFQAHFIYVDLSPVCSNLSIAKSRAQSGKLETGMLHPKLRSRNITCREGRRRSESWQSREQTLLLIRLALQWASLFYSLKYCLFGNNVTEITYTISFNKRWRKIWWIHPNDRILFTMYIFFSVTKLYNFFAHELY